MNKPQSQARILAFKDLADTAADTASSDDNEQRWRHVAAALCWAGGCGCPNGPAFEDSMLALAALLNEKGKLVDANGNAVDLARRLAEGLPAEVVKRMTEQ